MKKYNVWWLGGYLNNKEERERYNDLGHALAKVFARVAVVNDHFRKHYQFNWEQRVTNKFFRDKCWRSDKTAAILFHTHSDVSVSPPIPLVYHWHLDAGEKVPAPKDWTQLHLLPAKLGKSSRSLRLIGLFFCYSHLRIKEWQKMAPWAEIVSSIGALGASSSLEAVDANLNRWILSSKNMPDCKMASSWEVYKKYEESIREIKNDPNFDLMKTGKNLAYKNAWLFFKALVYHGPAGPPPKPTERGGGCSMFSYQKNFRTRVPGPARRIISAPRRGFV